MVTRILIHTRIPQNNIRPAHPCRSRILTSNRRAGGSRKWRVVDMDDEATSGGPQRVLSPQERDGARFGGHLLVMRLNTRLNTDRRCNVNTAACTARSLHLKSSRPALRPGH